MKNIDLFILQDALKDNFENLKKLQGAKFTYIIIKNTNILDKEISTILEIVKPTVLFQEYENKRTILCEKYVKKDKDGNIIQITNPVTNEKEYDIDITDPKWLKDIDGLKNQYIDELKNRELQINTYNEFLQKPTNIDFEKIDFDIIPNDISLELMLVIKSFINE